eukprot:tig00000396_g24904.t1
MTSAFTQDVPFGPCVGLRRLRPPLVAAARAGASRPPAPRRAMVSRAPVRLALLFAPSGPHRPLLEQAEAPAAEAASLRPDSRCRFFASDGLLYIWSSHRPPGPFLCPAPPPPDYGP